MKSQTFIHFFLKTIGILILALVLFRCAVNNEEPSLKNFELIEIQIPDSSLKILEKNKEKALELGIITPDLKKYLGASLVYNNKKIPIKLRFKGDWIDHLRGNKWSFRISILGDNSFNGMKTFSIQSPETRSFLEEWLIHKLFIQEDILTTRYDFKEVKLNGVDLGVYALEEHFQKQLIEHNKRREGPIVKFDEEGIWETRIKKEFYTTSFPFFEAANIIPFKKNKTLKKTSLVKNFNRASSLMLDYKKLNGDLNQIFDLEKVAKYYALCDLARVRHAFHWHNQRFYFNPVSNQLEHIGFDCFAGFDENEKDIIYGFLESDKVVKESDFLNKQFFNSSIFKNHYISYLKKYSSKQFISKIESDHSIEINHLLNKLQIEYPSYSYNLNRYRENARLIDSLLPEYERNDYTYSCYKTSYSHLDTIGEFFFPSIGIKSNWKNSRKKEQLVIKNYHFSNVEIVGYFIDTSKIIPLMNEEKSKIILSKYTTFPDSILLEVDTNAIGICFIPKNTKAKEFSKIQYWKYDANSSIERFENTSTIDRLPSDFTIDTLQKTISLSKGKYNFKANITIPENWLLKVEEGTSIELNDSCFILSYSPVQFLGSKNQRILFSNGSFIVIGSPKDTSILNYVDFENCSLNPKSNWTLTGAVTLYNTNIQINNSTFKDNLSEDGLNLISCNFNLENSVVDNTYSDGFDADFCNGRISNCTFSNTKNDGVDISGSSVFIENSKLFNIRDKAISSGENSTLKASNCVIDHANIAFASKDKSIININDVNVSNCNVCYAAFQKKPEYNPASIIVSNSTEINNNSLHLIDFNSRLEINKTTIIGSEHINVDSLYIPFK